MAASTLLVPVGAEMEVPMAEDAWRQVIYHSEEFEGLSVYQNCFAGVVEDLRKAVLPEATELSLVASGIVTLPLKQLKHLDTLILADQSMSVIPPEIGELVNLTTLYLDFLDIEDLPPELGRCARLKGVHIRGNTKLSALPPEIGDLRELERLRCNKNALTSLPAELADCAKLRFLDCSDNKIARVPAELRYFEKLDLICHSDHLVWPPSDIVSTLEAGKLTAWMREHHQTPVRAVRKR